MVKLNRNYSDYTDETDPNYPEGKAINATTSESYDGTPCLDEFMNDVNAAHIAMYEKAYGSRAGISGKADTQKSSQFADAVAKYTDDKVKAHADHRGLANGVHGATSEATPGQIVSRDEYGCAKVSAPMAEDDIARKKEVDDAKASVVASVSYNAEKKEIQQTIGGESSGVVSVAILKKAMNLSDDVVDVVEDKNMSAVSSNAVYKALKDYGTFICSLGVAAEKTIDIGVALADGITCKVMFLNGHYSIETADIMRLNGKKIYINRSGKALLFKGHEIVADPGKYWYLQGYTTLELVYMSALDEGNGGWMVIGNPIVLDCSSEDGSASYSVKANGKLSNGEFPIGAITAFSGTSIPITFLICNGSWVSIDDYPDLWSVIGDTFGYDDGDNTFKLPDLRGQFLQGKTDSENVGQTKTAGLPNIIGNAGSGYWREPKGTPSGALKTTTSGGGNRPSGDAHSCTVIRFDAQNGETKADGTTLKASTDYHVYGKSDTVQPPAVTVNFIIKAKY